VKIFDPRDASRGSVGAELLDASVVRRNDQWWMYLAGQPDGYGATDIYSASLSPGLPLSAFGWEPNRDAVGKLGLSPRVRQTVKTLLTVRCRFIVPDPGTDLGWACR